MRDVLIDPSTNDLRVINGALVLTDSAQYVGQKATILIRTQRGEIWLNPTLGIPWMTNIFALKGQQQVVAVYVQQELLRIPGVTAVIDLEVSLDTTTRTFTLNATVVYNGEQVELATEAQL